MRYLVSHYIACYTLWIAFSALAFVIIDRTRVVLFDLMAISVADRWIVSAVDKFGFVTLGLLWLVAVLVIESYLRHGVERRRLWRRAALVLAAEGALLGLAYGLGMVI
jgi:hypothetical protein